MTAESDFLYSLRRFVDYLLLGPENAKING